MSFVVDLLNGSDQPIGDGPLTNVLSVSVGEALDEAAQIAFVVPATDYRAATLIDQAVRFRVRFSDGTLAYGLISGDAIDAASAQPTRQVTGFDLLAELNRYSVGWWCFYGDEDLNSVVLPDMVAGTGWSLGTVEAALGNFQGRLDGLSRFAALLNILQQLPGRHIRMGSTLRTLDLGTFGSLSATRLTNVDHHVRAQDTNTAIAIIGSLQITSNRAPIVNRLIPWGCGDDNGDVNRAKVKLFHLPSADARWANIKAKPGARGVQTVVTDINEVGGHHWEVVSTAGMFEWPITQLFWCYDPEDLTLGFGYNFVISSIWSSTALAVGGSGGYTGDPVSFPAVLITNPQLYLEDASAYASNPNEATLVFNDIKLNSLASGDWALGAAQLYNRAKRYLDTHKVAQRTYQVSVINAPYTLRVGDKVRVIYRGVVTRNGVTVNWIDLDEDLFVIKINRTYNADGSTSATLDVSNIDAQPVDDTTVLADSAGQTGSMAMVAG